MFLFIIRPKLAILIVLTVIQSFLSKDCLARKTSEFWSKSSLSALSNNLHGQTDLARLNIIKMVSGIAECTRYLHLVCIFAGVSGYKFEISAMKIITLIIRR